MQDDSVSTSDPRQPYHMVDGKLITQAEWREKLRDATALFDEFKRAAYKEHEL